MDLQSIRGGVNYFCRHHRYVRVYQDWDSLVYISGHMCPCRPVIFTCLFRINNATTCILLLHIINCGREVDITGQVIGVSTIIYFSTASFT